MLVSHGGDGCELALDGVEAPLDSALTGEDLLDLGGVNLWRGAGLGRLHPQDATTASHRRA